MDEVIIDKNNKSDITCCGFKLNPNGINNISSIKNDTLDNIFTKFQAPPFYYSNPTKEKELFVNLIQSNKDIYDKLLDIQSILTKLPKKTRRNRSTLTKHKTKKSR